jgi:two-component system OmpR family sensor kinase
MHEHVMEWWNGVSLRTKITGVTVMLLTLGLLVAGLGTMSVLRNYLVAEQDDKISADVLALSGTIKFETEGESIACTIQIVPTEYYVAALSSDGDVLCDNKSLNKDRPDVEGLTLAKVQDHDRAFNVFNESRTSQWRVAAYVASDAPVTVVVGLDLDDTNALIANYAATFLFFAITVVVLGGALTRLLVTSTFGPLREVEETAARFAAGDFSQRLAGATPNTEVGRLNASLNTMLSRIDSAFADRARTIDQMRRFVGDASHELRTPLVSVRGYAELYRMGALPGPEEISQAMERIEKEAIRMGSLVEDLLELARIDEAKPLHLAPVDLVPLAYDAALDAMASSPGRTVRVVVTDPISDPTLPEEIEEPPAPLAPLAPPASTKTSSRTATSVTGPIGFAGATIARLRSRRPRPVKELEQDADVEQTASTARATVLAEENKIRQVITNLMGNALRFTTVDSPIEIEVTVDEKNDSAIISVIDHGEGIPPQIREKIFQRFWRADSSRNRDTGGSGLGLAIVASIVASHRGTVNVEETPGGGSTFRVRLPLLHEMPEPEGAPSED